MSPFVNIDKQKIDGNGGGSRENHDPFLTKKNHFVNAAIEFDSPLTIAKEFIFVFSAPFLFLSTLLSPLKREDDSYLTKLLPRQNRHTPSFAQRVTGFPDYAPL